MNLQKSEPNCKKLANAPDDTVPRLATIKELMLLEERRLELEASLGSIRLRINYLQRNLVSSLLLCDVENPAQNGRVRLNETSRANETSATRMVRGQLRMQIISALEAVGPQGISVPDLARSLGMKPVNVHSWFHSARKRMPEIKKSAPGHYYLDGIPACIPNSTLGQSQRIVRRGGRARRGETTRKIMEVLNAEGGKALAVADIAARIGMHCRNVHVWLSSTGKKNPLIVRSGRGVYQMLQAAPESVTAGSNGADNGQV